MKIKAEKKETIMDDLIPGGMRDCTARGRCAARVKSMVRPHQALCA